MALDTYSDVLGVLLQATGNNNNSWGDNANNAVFKVLERAVAGSASRAVTGGTLNLSASAPPAGMTQAIDAIQMFSGTLASDQIVQVPNLTKIWLVHNGTTGAHTLTFKTTDGVASRAIPQGGWSFIYCDGADNIDVGLSTTLRDVQWLGADGSIGAPGLSFEDEPTLGFRRVSSGTIALTIGGVDVVTFTATSISFDSGVTFSITPPGMEADYAGIFEPQGWYFEDGSTKSRVTDKPLFDAITAQFTADTNASATLSNVSIDLRNKGVEGAIVEGTGIPTGATIVSVDSATQITLSVAATNTAAGGAMRAFIHGNGDGSTTFNLPDGRDVAYVGRGNMGGTKRNLITVGATGVDSSLLTKVGGAETVTMVSANIAQHDHAVYLHDTGHSHTYSRAINAGIQMQQGGFSMFYTYDTQSTSTNVTGITIWSASGGTGNQNKTAMGGNVSPTGMRVIQPSAFRNKIIKR